MPTINYITLSYLKQQSVQHLNSGVYMGIMPTINYITMAYLQEQSTQHLDSGVYIGIMPTINYITMAYLEQQSAQHLDSGVYMGIMPTINYITITINMENLQALNGVCFPGKRIVSPHLFQESLDEYGWGRGIQMHP